MPEEVRGLFQRPAAGIGLATGEGSGVWVLDLDVKNGVDGLASIAHMDIPDTYTVETPSGGRHLYFLHAEGVRNRAAVLPGVDVRGDGGYVVAAGSKTPIGGYRVVNPTRPVEAPPEVLDLVLRKQPQPVTPPSVVKVDRYALTALEKYAKKTKADAALKRRATKLVKQYKLR